MYMYVLCKGYAHWCIHFIQYWYGVLHILYMYTVYLMIYVLLSIMQGVCVANIMALVELMTPDHYRSLRHSFDLKEDLEVSKV